MKISEIRAIRRDLFTRLESYRETFESEGFNFGNIIRTAEIKLTLSNENIRKEGKQKSLDRIDRLMKYFNSFNNGDFAEAKLQIEIIKEFLEQLPKRATANKNAHSYTLKHVCEDLMGEGSYIPNIFVQVAAAEVEGIVNNSVSDWGGQSINENYNITTKAMDTLQFFRHFQNNEFAVKPAARAIADCQAAVDTLKSYKDRLETITQEGTEMEKEQEISQEEPQEAAETILAEESTENPAEAENAPEEQTEPKNETETETDTIEVITPETEFEKYAIQYGKEIFVTRGIGSIFWDFTEYCEVNEIDLFGFKNTLDELPQFLNKAYGLKLNERTGLFYDPNEVA